MPERSIDPERADWPDEQADDETPIRRLSRDEVQALIRARPSVSPWRVVALQLLVGGLCSVLLWAWLGGVVLASALYGVVVAVLPNALLARGMTRRTSDPLAIAAGFLFWEMLKIGAAIVLLLIAVRVVPHLSWPVLLVTMVVCMKVNWLALLWRGRRTTTTKARYDHGS